MTLGSAAEAPQGAGGTATLYFYQRRDGTDFLHFHYISAEMALISSNITTPVYVSSDRALISPCQELKAQAAQDRGKLDDAPHHTEPSKASKTEKKRKKADKDARPKQKMIFSTLAILEHTHPHPRWH